MSDETSTTEPSLQEQIEEAIRRSEEAEREGREWLARVLSGEVDPMKDGP